ncbi:hypothetical protein GH714_009265 [Hevea brasiliensis]|uniref:FF domain-containing protein n=1 Tax=Hevea brasiliensis TaxID=3981 RepID=A0A6A6L3S7_HEVBR|nr:hypothetical protein GH714_009265 [Hevea brasiliensis]
MFNLSQLKRHFRVQFYQPCCCYWDNSSNFLDQDNSSSANKATAQDKEEAANDVVISEKANNISLEDKAVSQEPLTYADKLEVKSAFKALLESANVGSDWTWDQVMFRDHLQDLEKEEEEQRKIQKEEMRKAERKNRDEFRKLLEQHVADGSLIAKAHWHDYQLKVKDLPAYLAVASNTSGSTSKVLFEDVAEDLGKQFHEEKTWIKDAVKLNKVALASTWTLEDFKAAIMEDISSSSVSDVNPTVSYLIILVGGDLQYIEVVASFAGLRVGSYHQTFGSFLERRMRGWQGQSSVYCGVYGRKIMREH